jgi:hypothetical protein
VLRVVPIFVRIGFYLLRCSGAGVESGACEMRETQLVERGRTYV